MSNTNPSSGVNINPDGTVEFKTGWQDLMGPLIAVAKVTGASQPTWEAVSGGIYGYSFSPTAMNECRVGFHVMHDYEPDSAMYPHLHILGTGTATGVVRLGFEYIIMPGFDRGVSHAPVTVYVDFDITDGVDLMAYIAEVSDEDVIPGSNLAVDYTIAMRIFRDGAHANDTYPNKIFIETCDIHYRADRVNTELKRPPFYG